MANPGHRRYVPGTRVVVRCPLLPFDHVLAWSEEAADLETLRLRMKEMVASAPVREALAMACPGIEPDIDHWQRDVRGRRARKVERTLVRYLSRMATRPTPFGMFASLSAVPVGDSDELWVSPIAECQGPLQVDAEFLSQLADALVADPQTRQRLRFVGNCSLRKTGSRMVFERRDSVSAAADQPPRRYATVDLPGGRHWYAILELAAEGLAPGELVRKLLDRNSSLSRAGAEMFVDRAVSAQVITPLIGRSVTGPRPLDAFITELERSIPEHELVGSLIRVRERLFRLSRARLGHRASDVRQVVSELGQLISTPEKPRILHGELFRPPGRSRISRHTLSRIESSTVLLRRISGCRQSDSQALEDFKKRFVSRFGAAEVPLATALHQEGGKEFSCAPLPRTPELLAAIPRPGPLASRSWTRRDSFVLRRVATVGPVWELTEQDLQALDTGGDAALPDAFAILASLSGDQEYPTIVLDGGAGPSGGRVLGRFCHNSEDIRDLLDEHVRAEERLRPGCVFAEVTHFPEESVASVVSRPLLRTLEIPVSGTSGVAPERRLSLTDLTLSVVDNKFVLRSVALHAQVLPRQSSAYRPRHRHPILRFLLALEDGDGGEVSWDWGPLADVPFLPRVCHGKTVFARARWSFTREDLATFVDSAQFPDDIGPENLRDQRLAVDRLREKFSLPRFVMFCEGDKELLVDFDNALSVDSFAHKVRGRRQLAVVELFPEPEGLLAGSEHGRYMQQVVVPFTAHSQVAVSDAVVKRLPGRSSPQLAASTSHGVGSPWLTLILRGQSDRADQVLREMVRPLAQQAGARGVADRWFYTRYIDGQGPHLRMRLHGEPSRLASIVPAAMALAQPLIAAGTLGSLGFGTYEPEQWRYGGAKALPWVERLFATDSDASCEVVSLLEPREGDSRWLLAVRSVDRICRDLGVSVVDRWGMCREAESALAEEFDCNRAVDGIVGARFRRQKVEIADAIAAPTGGAHALASGFDVLDDRSRAWEEPICALKKLERERQLTRPLSAIAGCLIHMHINRLMAIEPRRQERVLHGLLRRHYGSVLAQQRALAARSEAA